MQATRRDFLKVAAIGGTAATVFGFDLAPAYAQLRELKIARATETRTTCPYCAVGCGAIIYTLGDKAKNVTSQVIHVEGDADHPTNRGTLCPKGLRSSRTYSTRGGSQSRKSGGPARPIGRTFRGIALWMRLRTGRRRRATQRLWKKTRMAAPRTAAKASRSSAAAPTQMSSIIWL